MSSPPALALDQLFLAYGAQTVVHELSLHIAQGETFGLIGLNGAGKTTIIKSILGLRALQAGSITILGQCSLQKQARSNVVYLPERFDPPWFLTGAEFIEFSAKIYGQKITKDEAEFYAQKLALDPAVLKKRVQTYSKGMRQKLGIIATFLTPCHFVILDEPMSGLDPLARSLVKDMLAEARTEGKTILMSSHILADMDEICDRIAVLHDQKIRFIGKPDILKEKVKAKNLERAFLSVIE